MIIVYILRVYEIYQQNIGTLRTQISFNGARLRSMLQPDLMSQSCVKITTITLLTLFFYIHA